MSTFKGRYWLNFDAENSQKPLIHGMSKAFDIVFYIRQATISDTMGLMAIELEGERTLVKGAIQWLEDHGVSVEPIEINTIEG